jgi:hypothetical protein
MVLEMVDGDKDIATCIDLSERRNKGDTGVTAGASDQRQTLNWNGDGICLQPHRLPPTDRHLRFFLNTLPPYRRTVT